MRLISFLYRFVALMLATAYHEANRQTVPEARMLEAWASQGNPAAGERGAVHAAAGLPGVQGRPVQARGRSLP